MPVTAGRIHTQQEQETASRTWAAAKRGPNSKFHLAVDAHGMPVKALVTQGTTAEGTQVVALIDGVTAERLLADRDLTPMRFLSRRQDRGYRRSLCPKAGVQSGVVRTKSLTRPGT